MLVSQKSVSGKEFLQWKSRGGEEKNYILSTQYHLTINWLSTQLSSPVGLPERMFFIERSPGARDEFPKFICLFIQCWYSPIPDQVWGSPHIRNKITNAKSRWKILNKVVKSIKTYILQPVRCSNYINTSQSEKFSSTFAYFWINNSIPCEVEFRMLII